MKGMNFQMLAVAVVAAVLAACGVGKSDGNKSSNKNWIQGAFPMVSLPTYVNDQEQAVKYMARNYWDDFFKIELDGKDRGNAVHGVDSSTFAGAFGTYARLASVTGAREMREPVAEFFSNLDSLALKGERRPLLLVMELMEHYFASGRNIKLVVQLVDMRHPPSADDLNMLHFLQSMGLPFVIALTKSDKLNKTQRNARLEALKEELSFLDNYVAIPFSSQNGEGVDQLKEQIEKSLTQGE